MKEVTIYSTKGCPYCDMAKEYFNSRGINVKEVNVGSDKKAAEEMMERSGEMSVPQIAIGDRIIVGFNRHKIEKELEEPVNGY